MNEDENGVPGIKVNLLKSTSTFNLSNNLNVRVFSTHNRNGSTNQYGAYPTLTSEYDRLFNTSFSNTVLHWQGVLNINTILNWNTWSILANSGIPIPNNGEFFSVEVTGTFTATETGLYSFGVNSDDGSDILINNVLVTSYYGGHGMGGFQYGSVSLIAGVEYSFKARVQEFGGGEGLQVIWKKPSQFNHSLQIDELGTKTEIMSPFFIHNTYTTDPQGEASINVNTNTGEVFRIQIQEPSFTNVLNFEDFVEIVDFSLQKKQVSSYHFHKWDLNNDNRITITDAFINFNRLSGETYTKQSFLFTDAQWTDLKNNNINLKSSIPGFRSLYEYTPLNNQTINFYILTPGIKDQNIIEYQGIQ